MSLSDNDYELLSAYIDNQLTEAERATLDARLSDEPELQEELDALRSVSMLVGNLPTLKAPRDFTLTADMVADTQATKTPDNIRQLPIPVSSIRKSPLRLFAAVAVVFVAVMFLGLMISNEVDELQPMAVAMQSTETPITQPTKILADFDIAQGAESNAAVIVPGTATMELAPAGGSDAALRSASPADDTVEGSDNASDAELALEFSITETAAMALLPTQPPLEMALDDATLEGEFALDEIASDGAGDTALYNAVEEVESAEDNFSGTDDAAGIGGATGADLADESVDSGDTSSAVMKTDVSETMESANTQQQAMVMTATAEMSTDTLPADSQADTDSEFPEQLPEMRDADATILSLGLLVAQLISLVILGIWLLISG